MAELSRGYSLRSAFPELPPLVFSILFFDFVERRSDHVELEWRQCHQYIVDQGLEGLAVRYQRESNSPAPQDIIRSLRDASFDRMAALTSMSKRSAEALDLLRQADIEFVVTKGPGIGRLSRSPIDRTYSDLDVLVEPTDFEKSVTLLSREGFEERPETRPPRAIFGRHCREAVNLRSPSGASVDVHQRIPPWIWSSGLTLDHFLSGVQLFDCQGTVLPVASPVHNLLVTALHVVSDQGRPGRTLRSWRDLVLLASQCSNDEIAQVSRETGLNGWLDWIFRSMPTSIQPAGLLEALSPQADHVTHPWRLRMVLSPRIIDRPAVEQCLRLPVRKWPIFAIAMVVPRRSYVELRYGDDKSPYLSWWRRILAGGKHVAT
jgi:hypothetical protein